MSGAGTPTTLSDNTIQSITKIFLFQFWSPPPLSGYSGPVNTTVNYNYDDPATYQGPVIRGILKLDMIRFGRFQDCV